MVLKEAGIKTEGQLLDMFKTLQNISDAELQGAQLDVEGKRIELRKKLLSTDISLDNINAEIQHRIRVSQTQDTIPPTVQDDFALAPRTVDDATLAPCD